MIRGYGASNKNHVNSDPKSMGASNLPIPFNIPNVLYNLLYADVGLKFTRKQTDMLETLQFAYRSVGKMQARFQKKDQELQYKIIENPDDVELKEEFTEMQLDIQEANQHFKDLVTTMADLLEREQYAKLLKFCNIPV